jgi:mannose-6-phosphate isomerase-like protein (cupin superfamily)
VATLEEESTDLMAIANSEPIESYWNPRGAYERWLSSLELPVHRGHFVDNLSTAEVAWWPERECNAAFIVLEGLKDLQEARIQEIPPGKELPPVKIALEELVYVVGGRGICTVWGQEGLKKFSFEWHEHSIFMIPPNYTVQLSNVSGTTPARLLHTNYLPLALQAVGNVDFFFNNPKVDLSILYGDDQNPFSLATASTDPDHRGQVGNRWTGNFLPDMAVWDKLQPNRKRGAGGVSVYFQSKTGKSGHMSVFPPARYKMAHRHGPGRVIVIPKGEGYSILWPQGGEKTVVEWQEGSVFTPPDQWFHQHFNVGNVPARYLAISRPRPVFDTDESLDARQIPYTEEDPWVRQKFEEELAKRGHTSLMPEEAYRDRNYKWKYA